MSRIQTKTSSQRTQMQEALPLYNSSRQNINFIVYFKCQFGEQVKT